MAAYKWKTEKELREVFNRLTTPTVASSAAVYWYNPQEEHVKHIRTFDNKCKHMYGNQERANAAKLEEIVERITRPTTASKAAKYDFDAQVCHIEYLQREDPKMLNFSHMQGKKSEEVEQLTERIAKPTVSSTGAKHLQPPIPPKKEVSADDMSEIVKRTTRPTVASRGGIDLLNKDFTYMVPPKCKTLPIIKGIGTRYKGTKKVSDEEMEDIVARLTKPNHTYQMRIKSARYIRQRCGNGEPPRPHTSLF